MNGLTPQIRTDRNGKTVTRWVKSDSSGDALKPLPAPSLPPANTVMRENLKAELSKMPFSSNAIKTIDSMSDAEVSIISDAYRRGGEEYGVYFAGHFFAPQISQYSIHTLSVVYDPDLFDTLDGDSITDFERRFAVNTAIRTATDDLYLDPDKPEDYTPLESELLRNTVKYYSIATANRNDNEVLQMVTGKTDYDPVQAFRVYEANPTFSAEQIRDVIDSGTSAFSSGVL